MEGGGSLVLGGALVSGRCLSGLIGGLGLLDLPSRRRTSHPLLLLPLLLPILRLLLLGSARCIVCAGLAVGGSSGRLWSVLLVLGEVFGGGGSLLVELRFCVVARAHCIFGGLVLLSGLELLKHVGHVLSAYLFGLAFEAS